MNKFPKDPYILLSFINTKLRDTYQSPEALSQDLSLDLDEITSVLSQAGFSYDKRTNSFR